MKISVAMCTYNGERFLKEQIDSILAQTVSVQEIVVCDDGSNDKTLEILQEYFNQFPTIFRIYQNEKTLKSVKNFEKAISLCTGDITFLCDQDDYWYPEKVKKIVDKFEQNPEILGCCSNGFVMNDESEIMVNHFTKWDVCQKFLQSQSTVNHFNFATQKGNFSTGATMAVRTKFAQAAFPIPIVKDFHHDEWLTLLATVNEKMLFIPEKLINYRIHKTQQVGGVAFPKNSTISEEMYHYFTFNLGNDFKSIKSRIKSQVEWHNRFLIYFKSNPEQFKIVHEKFVKEYQKNTTSLKQNFPIKATLINTFDTILNKRQLKKI